MIAEDKFDLRYRSLLGIVTPTSRNKVFVSREGIIAFFNGCRAIRPLDSRFLRSR